MKSDRSRPLAWHCEVTRQIPRVLFEENLMTWPEFIRQVCLDVDNLPLKLVFCLLIWLVLRTEFRQRAIYQVKVKVSVEEGLISNGHLLSLCSLQPSCYYIRQFSHIRFFWLLYLLLIFLQLNILLSFKCSEERCGEIVFHITDDKIVVFRYVSGELI